MQGNTTEIDERNLLRLDALLSHGYGLSPQLVITWSSSMRFHCPVGAVAFGSLTGCHSSNLLSFGYSTSSPIIGFFTNRQCLRAGS